MPQNNDSSHVVFFSGSVHLRMGGPSGYLANLIEGMHQIEEGSSASFIRFAAGKKTESQIKPKRKYFSEIKKSSFVKAIKSYLAIRKEFSRFESFLNNSLSSNLERILEITSQTKTIHVHTAPDACLLFNTLKKLQRQDIKIMFTPHTPESLACEVTQKLKDTYPNLSDSKLQQLFNVVLEVENKALSVADILVFPSKEAMEPLAQTNPNFESLIENKDIRYFATGTTALETKLTSREARKKYGVEDKFAVCFIGRHNEVKGYDLLVKVAEVLNTSHPDIHFLVAGKNDSNFEISHLSNWIELGYVQPGDVLKASDCFVLPNRRTFYDLVLLEALSIGLPIVASATGGNISVSKTVETLSLFDISNDPVKELADAIVGVYEQSPCLREKIGTRNRECFEQYFTNQKFAERYVSLIEEIHSVL